MQGIYNPIFIRLGNRGRGLTQPRPGSLENVSITNVIATGSVMTSYITGLPGFPVRHVRLDNVRLTMKGGAEKAKDLEVPEIPEEYPETGMWGHPAACALAQAIQKTSSRRRARSTPPRLPAETRSGP